MVGVQTLFLGTIAFVLFGCGGNTARQVERESTLAGASSGGGGTGGSSPLAGLGDAGLTASGGVDTGLDLNLTPSGFPRCGPFDPDRADDCEGIESITPRSPDVSSTVGGTIQVGESGPFHVWVENGDAVDHDDVCVGVAVDTPGIALTAEDGTNPRKLGQMYPGGIFIITPAFFAVRNVEPGTIARFTTWTTYEGTNCLGPTATVDALVKPSPY